MNSGTDKTLCSVHQSPQPGDSQQTISLAKSRMNRKTYRAEIDGLRAVAIMPVVLFHLDVGFPGGYTGVDIFFVISGFLITSIIEKEVSEKRFSIISFWERRVRRIFPPLLLMVLATLAVGYYLLIPQELVALGEAAIAQTIFAANLFYWQESDYFTGPTDLKPLLHTWSLAVEEQFYFFLPLILLAAKKCSVQTKFNLLSVLAAVSLATSIYGIHAAPTATFYLLPMRAWELLAGSLLAVSPWKANCSQRWASLLSIVGIALVTGPFFLLDKTTAFPGLAAIPSVAGTALLIYATANTNSGVKTALTFKPIVFLGQISYSLYLWHWPVIVYLRIYRGGIGLDEALFCLIISLSLAVLSFRFVEQPFRTQRFLQDRNPLFLSAVVSSLVTIVIGSAFVISGGYPKRFPNYSSELTADLDWKGNEYATALSAELNLNELPTLGLPLQESSQQNQLDFLVWGDSHARTFCYLIDELAKDMQLSGKAVVTAGVLGLPGVHQPYNENAPTQVMLKRQDSVMAILEQSPPKNLIVANRWSAYTDGPSEHDYASKNPKASQIMDNDSSHNNDASATAILIRGLEKLATVCERQKIKLWIIEQVPETGENQPAREMLLWSVGLRTQPSNLRKSREDHNNRQQKAQEAFRHVDGLANRLNPAEQLLDERGMTLNYLDGRAIYRDDDHLTKWGLQRLRPIFFDAMMEMKLQKEQN